MKCQHCGATEVLPFKCPYCNRYFCPEHRLPENHECPEIWQARAPREAPPQATVKSRTPYEYRTTYGPQAATRKFWFSPAEIRHLTLSALIVTGVGFSISFSSFGGSLGTLSSPEILIGSTLVFVSVFLLHEIAHKLVAQHYGLWAEFRLTLFGALITLVSIFSPFFKIISPGAVMIAGYANKDTVGRTAVAGPSTNLVLSIVSLAIYLAQPHLLLALVSAAVNAWIALFNLIPLGVLDGWKVFSWSKIIWMVEFFTSVVLSVITFARL